MRKRQQALEIHLKHQKGRILHTKVVQLSETFAWISISQTAGSDVIAIVQTISCCNDELPAVIRVAHYLFQDGEDAESGSRVAARVRGRQTVRHLLGLARKKA